MRIRKAADNLEIGNDYENLGIGENRNKRGENNNEIEIRKEEENEETIVEAEGE